MFSVGPVDMLAVEVANIQTGARKRRLAVGVSRERGGLFTVMISYPATSTPVFFNLFLAAEPSTNVRVAHGTLWHRVP